ncbi:MAG TPA: hypothetical protein VK974_01240 [Methylophilaceae bacterium]|nr:hypothetical protein [Methylophilaceae bacterium]
MNILRLVVLLALAVNSLFLVLNGLFMLFDPKTWYEVVPGVITTGFYNQHFIRDIGIVQLFLGVAFVVGWYQPSQRLALWGVASLWLLAHAMFHLWEVAVGICGPSALARDFAAVSLPAIIGIVAITTIKE